MGGNHLSEAVDVIVRRRLRRCSACQSNDDGLCGAPCIHPFCVHTHLSVAT